MRQGPNKRGRGRGGNGPHNMGGGQFNGGYNGGGAGGGNRRPSMPNRNQSFDSSGPDVRIRGSAYQVHEKYMNLAQDATAAGDRIMAESYYQHAEHYYRIINAQDYGVDGQRRRYDGPGQGQDYQQHGGNEEGQPDLDGEQADGAPDADNRDTDEAGEREQRPRQQQGRDQQPRDHQFRERQPRDDRALREQQRERQDDREEPLVQQPQVEQRPAVSDAVIEGDDEGPVY